MKFRITDNHPLTAAVWSMTLQGERTNVSAPGQFVQVQLPGFYLRRPISVCDWTEDTLRLVYKVVGKGTDAMTAMQPGTELDLLTGLGNGFDLNACGDSVLLVGGGVGLPPMLGLCRALLAAGKKVQAAAGFNTADEVFLAQDFAALGVPLHLATMDGSAGVKGFATDAIRDLTYDTVCACGPLPMLKAVHNAVSVPGFYSMEERMGCGFGACMGCTIMTTGGAKRVCKEGPVFAGEEIIW